MTIGIKGAILSTIMVFALISNLRAFRLQALTKTGGVLSRPYRRSVLATIRRKKENDFIEAEIVGEENQTDQSERITRRQDSFPLKKESEGIFNKLTKFFGQDEESKRKKEQKKAMNTAIDKVLEGTGPLGALVGGLAKGIGGMLTESIIAASRDSEAVQDAVQFKLEQNDACVSLLGGSVGLGAPFTSSSSSMNINGNVSKQVFLIMPVSGSRGSGQVQVQASIGPNAMVSFTSLILQTNSGAIDVLGGGGGGGGGGRGRMSGTVIDVEVVK